LSTVAVRADSSRSPPAAKAYFATDDNRAQISVRVEFGQTARAAATWRVDGVEFAGLKA